MSQPPSLSRRGTVLILALVVTVILSLAVLTFSRLMISERKGANYSLRQKQARLLAESGVQWLRLYLSQGELTIRGRGDLYDNLEFCAVIVNDGTISATRMLESSRELSSTAPIDPRDVGRFTVLAPALSEDGSLIGDGFRYGLEDESAKLNLHWVVEVDGQFPGLGRIILTRLPGITDAIADAILDWMDEDDEPREYGAESEFYSLLDPPYRPRNAVPDSIDELLLVEGVTPQLLYGIDWNRNGLWDRGEPDPSTLEDAFGVSDESLNLGLAAYLTVDSRESQLTPDGLLRINVNSEDLTDLHAKLVEALENEEWANYIVAYRQYGSGTSSAASSLGDIQGGQSGANGGVPGGTSDSGQSATSDSNVRSGGGSGTISLTQEATTEINSLLDLVGGLTRILYEGASEPQTLNSPFSSDPDSMRNDLPLLYDQLMLSDEPTVGRINFNQAPRAILEMLSTEFDDTDEFIQSVYGSMGIDASTLGTASAADSGEDAEQTTGASILAMLGIPADEVDPFIQGILDNRIPDPVQAEAESPEMLYPFWPYTMGITEDLEMLKKIEPYFCTRGSVYRTQVVGRFDAKSPAVRFEVWIDASVRPAKILRIRELTELGPGFPPDILGIDDYYENLR